MAGNPYTYFTQQRKEVYPGGNAVPDRRWSTLYSSDGHPTQHAHGMGGPAYSWQRRDQQPIFQRAYERDKDRMRAEGIKGVSDYNPQRMRLQIPEDYHKQSNFSYGRDYGWNGAREDSRQFSADEQEGYSSFFARERPSHDDTTKQFVKANWSRLRRGDR